MDKAQTQIHKCCHQQTCRHKTPDIASVRQKSVGKLPYCIGEEQHRSDDAQFGFREDTFFHNGFLHHIQAQAADVIHAVP